MVQNNKPSSFITLIGVKKTKDKYIAYQILLDNCLTPDIVNGSLKNIQATKNVTEWFNPDGNVDEFPFKVKGGTDDIWDNSFIEAVDNYYDCKILNGLKFGNTKFFATVMIFKNDSGVWYLINKHDTELIGERELWDQFNNKNHITKVEYPIYVFADTYHVIMHDNIFYVYNYNTFDALFRNPQDLKPIVTKMVEKLASFLNLTDESKDILIKIVLERRMLTRKLDALTRHIKEIDPTPEKVKEVLARLNLNVEDYFKGNHLYITEVNAESLLDILNEDVSFGVISGKTYISAKKFPKRLKG